MSAHDRSSTLAIPRRGERIYYMLESSWRSSIVVPNEHCYVAVKFMLDDNSSLWSQEMKSRLELEILTEEDSASCAGAQAMRMRGLEIDHISTASSGQI